jgi:hypothetical protein
MKLRLCLICSLILSFVALSVCGASLGTIQKSGDTITATADFSFDRVIIYSEDKKYVTLEESNSYTDNVEQAASIYKEGDSSPIKGNKISFSCNPCSTASFSDAVDVIGSGIFFCGYDSGVPMQILLNDDKLCAQSEDTGLKYDFDLITWAAHGNCFDTDNNQTCNNVNNELYYERDDFDILLDEQYSGDDEYNLRDIGLRSGGSYVLHMYGNGQTAEKSFTYNNEKKLVLRDESQGAKIEFSDIYVRSGSKEDAGLQDKPDNYKLSVKARLGSTITVGATVKSLFGQVEDVSMTAVIYDMDDGSDLEDTSSSEDIKAGSQNQFQVKLDAPERLDDKIYTLEVKAEGTTAGRIITLQKKFTIGADLESHDLTIEDIMMVPGEILCNKSSELFFNIVNYGSQDEDEVAVTVKNAELGFDYKKDKISLGNGFDDDAVANLRIPVFYPNPLAGKHLFDIELYRDGNKFVTREAVQLNILQCNNEAMQQTTSQVITHESVEEGQVVDAQPEEYASNNLVVKKTEVKSSIWFYLLGLIVLFLLVFLVVLFVLVVLERKSTHHKIHSHKIKK